MKTTFYHASLLWIISVLPLLFQPAIATDLKTSGFKVVYHLDDTRNGRFALHLARDHLEINPDTKISIVAYAAGVDFLLKGAVDKHDRAYEDDIRALMDKGVRFKICSATLGFREISEDRVLDNIQQVPSGTYEIIRLQAEEGYVYLKP